MVALYFMGPEDSSPCSQEPATGPDHTVYFKTRINIIPLYHLLLDLVCGLFPPDLPTLLISLSVELASFPLTQRAGRRNLFTTLST